MVKRTGGVMHVATTTRRYKDKTYHTHLLRRSVREGTKVRKETLANLSHLPDEAIEAVRRVVPRACFGAPEGAVPVPRGRPHRPPAAGAPHARSASGGRSPSRNDPRNVFQGAPGGGGGPSGGGWGGGPRAPAVLLGPHQVRGVPHPLQEKLLKKPGGPSSGGDVTAIPAAVPPHSPGRTA